TLFRSSGAWQQRAGGNVIAAQEGGGRLCRAAGALQAERPERAFSARDGEALVEHRAGRGGGGAGSQLRSHQLDAFARMGEEGPGPGIEGADPALEFAGGAAPIEIPLAAPEFLCVGGAGSGLRLRCEPSLGKPLERGHNETRAERGKPVMQLLSAGSRADRDAFLQ